MKFPFDIRKPSFPFAAEIMLALCCVLPAHAAVHPIQHSAREQINARVITAAGHEIDALAKNSSGRTIATRSTSIFPQR